MTPFQRTNTALFLWSALFLAKVMEPAHSFSFQKFRVDRHRIPSLTAQRSNNDAWNDAHVAHGLDDVEEPNASDLHDAEEAAAVDAHDAIDAGMEAAAEERAVMLAQELAHKLHEDAVKKTIEKGLKDV